MASKTKVRNIKAPTKSAAKKETAKAAETKAAPVAKVARAKERVAFTNEAPSPYAGMVGAAKGAFTMAALLVSGMLTRKGDTFEIGSNGSPALFAEIVGDTPLRHHRKMGNIEGAKVTKQGLAHFTSRNEGNAPTYNTHLETVSAFTAAVEKGGEINSGGRLVKITRRVSVPTV